MNMTAIDLNSCKWRAFRVEEVFDVIGGSSVRKKDLQPGKIPYISALKHSNGVSAFISNQAKSETNFLSVNFNGEGGVVFNFYHPYTAVLSSDVKALKLKDIPSIFLGQERYVYLFIGILIFQQRSKYGFGYKLSTKRLNAQKIMLPVDKKGEIDFSFMVDYMKKIEESLDTSLLDSLNSEFNVSSNMDLKELQWNEYTINEIFSTVDSSPVSLDYNSLDNQFKLGDIPYVSRTSKNNGISRYIKDMTSQGLRPVKGDCITIGLDTVTVNYQPAPFYTGQNIHIIRDDKINKYTAQFVIPLIEQSIRKFGWGGYSATLSRFRKTKIMLPSKDNEPDWDAMESYIRSLPNSNVLLGV